MSQLKNRSIKAAILPLGLPALIIFVLTIYALPGWAGSSAESPLLQDPTGLYSDYLKSRGDYFTHLKSLGLKQNTAYSALQDQYIHLEDPDQTLLKELENEYRRLEGEIQGLESLQPKLKEALLRLERACVGCADKRKTELRNEISAMGQRYQQLENRRAELHDVISKRQRVSESQVAQLASEMEKVKNELKTLGADAEVVRLELGDMDFTAGEQQIEKNRAYLSAARTVLANSRNPRFASSTIKKLLMQDTAKLVRTAEATANPGN